MSTSFAVSATAQSGAVISAGSAAGTIKSAYRTFSLTGTKGTTFLLGDEVQIWGSNDGGSTYQPLVGPRGFIFLTFGSPTVVINDSCSHYAMQRTKVAAGSALAAVGLTGEQNIVGDPWIQGGNAFGATGILGTTDANPISLIAESQEFATSDGTTSRFGSALAAAGTMIEAGSNGLRLLGQNGAGAGGDVFVLPGTASAVRLLPRTTGAGNTSPLQFMELLANGGNSVGFKAPDAIAADVTWVLPNADANLANKALLSDGAGNLSWGNAIQSGAANLTNGVSAAIPANISATSRIFIQAGDVVPGAGNLTIDYRPLAADRVNGTPGSFKITAVIAAGTINALDQSQGIMWMVLNA